MSRESFIESIGATRRSTRWSWSAVNHEKRFVVFGAWNEYITDEGSLILSEDWVLNRKRTRRNPGYRESREHIRLIEEEGYVLKTFAMRMSNKERHLRGHEPAKIKDFEERLVERRLVTIGQNWFAT